MQRYRFSKCQVRNKELIQQATICVHYTSGSSTIRSREYLTGRIWHNGRNNKIVPVSQKMPIRASFLFYARDAGIPFSTVVNKCRHETGDPISCFVGTGTHWSEKEAYIVSYGLVFRCKVKEAGTPVIGYTFQVCITGGDEIFSR